MREVMSIQKVKVRDQRSRSQKSKANLAISGPYLQFELTYDNEMMHKAWCCLGEVPYCFSRSSVKFQGHTAKSIVDLDPNCAFPDRNSSFEFTDCYEMMHKAWSSIDEVSYCFSRSSAKLQGHTGQTIADFDPNWAFPDCNSSFNSLMALKWYTEFGVV